MEREPSIIVNIHEDDEGMRNIYPSMTAGDVSADMDTAIAASEQNRSPAGAGWTDVHLIQRPETTFADLGLKWSDCASALKSLLPEVSQFTVGGSPGNPFYSHDEKPCAFGYGNELFLKFEVSGGLVSHIWYEAYCSDLAKLKRLREAFVVLDQLQPCMLADYWMHATGYLSDRDFLDAYFKALAESASET